jgi:hypothetical protein
MKVVTLTDEERKYIDPPEYITIEFPDGDVFAGMGWCCMTDFDIETEEPIFEVIWDSQSPPILACWKIDCIEIKG